MPVINQTCAALRRALTLFLIAFFAGGLFLLTQCGEHALAAGFDSCRDQMPLGEPQLLHRANTTDVCHEAYAAKHDNDLLVPRWVTYLLTRRHTLGCIERGDQFHADEKLAEQEPRRARPTDYKKSRHDQGHQGPAADFGWNLDRSYDSFSMVNMAPQVPGLNRQGWERLEEYVRSWAYDRGELVVFVGPVVMNGGRTIGARKIAVPIAFWKVVVDRARGDALAFIMPQKPIAKGDLKPWQTTIASVEDAAGVKLQLPDGIDREKKATLWVTNLAAWKQKHKDTCAKEKRRK